MKTKIEFILPLANPVIEALLSHKESNKVKEAYNRASYKKSMRGLIE